MTLDPVTGLYYSRNRNCSPTLGRVLRQEPKSRFSAGAAYREINEDSAGYPGAEAQPRLFASAEFRRVEVHGSGDYLSLPLNINGANTYQFVESNPVGNVDPEGLDKSDAFVNGLAAQLGGADWLNNQTQNTGQTGGQVLGQAVQQQVPAPLLTAANLPNAVNPHTLAEGLADTAQVVQNGLIGMINFDFNHGPVGLALHALQQWVKSVRGWPSNIPSPQWDPYSDPTKPISEGLGAFAGPTLLLGPLGGLEDLGSPLTCSDHVPARMAEETGPYNNFPWSFDAVIISQGDFEIINGNYSLYTLPGSINGVDGFYEIGVNSDGQIVHRFFNPRER